MDLKDFHIANARIDHVRIGTGHHDGRGFFTIGFVSNSCGQGAEFPWDRQTIDDLIRITESNHLGTVEGKIVRVLRRDKSGKIDGIANIIDSGEDDVLILADAWARLKQAAGTA